MAVAIRPTSSKTKIKVFNRRIWINQSGFSKDILSKHQRRCWRTRMKLDYKTSNR